MKKLFNTIITFAIELETVIVLYLIKINPKNKLEVICNKLNFRSEKMYLKPLIVKQKIKQKGLLTIRE